MKKKNMLEKAYDPNPVEDKWSKFWINKGLFVPEVPSTKKKFSMVLPPPNVTGSLHMGHALCFTLPDIIVRWRRMQGYNTLWLPGTDHASIAVHNVIEQSLADKGQTREEVGREEFLKIAWEWKNKYGGVIINQLKKLGTSLDWTRERFTLDDGFSKTVKHVFIELYNEGLIYRDYYLVNRCPNCGTVLSDIEIEHKERQAKLYYIKYPLLNSEENIIVATTRPETMLGDTAVAVHPDDKRYRKIQGKKVLLPLVNREIPVITDERVEMEFGTGAVKVTPAHDPVDFELGKRHNLEQVIVIDGSGRMTEEAGEEFKGLDRFECRKKVLSKLEEIGLLEKTEDYKHAVGHCYRCQTIIEPHLSWQWFVRVEPLAKEAIRVVEEKKIKFIPPNWAKTYFEWMYNIHDWCISRQLWWGHRIPAWYCQKCEHVMVDMEAPKKCEKCQSVNFVQDEDVLDTWFSSALWPFATMGWPEETEDLKTFYPTDLLSTGFDIIFFWVARMIMMGLKFAGDIPFRYVYINGLVRDFKQRKMSKSEGNIIDPLEMIDKYGTDALRFTMAALAIPGMDISLSEERMAGYRTFANKIWNAARFVLMNIKGDEFLQKEEELTLADRWIRSRLAKVIEELNGALEDYKFYEAADKIYHFIWHEFCDWYIELVKPSLKEKNRTSEAVLVETLDQILRLLHPFIPFITEEIWQNLPSSGESLVTASFPKARQDLINENVESEMEFLQDAIVGIRTIRAENKIPPKQELELWVKVNKEKEKQIIHKNQIYIQTLANIRRIKILDQIPQEKKLLKGVAGSWEIAIPIEEGVFDLDQEKQRLQKVIAKLLLDIEKTESRLQNKNFLNRAPKEVIQETRGKLQELQNKKIKLEEGLEHILSLMS
ncbi:MAG: valine--tRNA ligase [Candidatus Aminicenantes bacterium]|nr:valine--tRNA ligase [Candidatus Aminicenantes bacterium]